METRLLILLVATLLAVAVGTGAVALDLHIGDGSSWHFPRGSWTESGGVISPPDVPDLHSRAFYKVKSYANPTVEFDFNGDYQENGNGFAGLIIRASDVNHFYLVYFPWAPQSMRAKGFWAAIAKVNGDGYIRNIKMAWVRSVPCETGRWYHVKVIASGTSISVTVDGRNAVSVTDSTYSSGCIGLTGYGGYGFRNVTVTGADTTPTWDTTLGIPAHSSGIGLDSTLKPTGCKAPNGDILIAAGNKMVRSTDGGITWGDPVTLPSYLGSLGDNGNTMFCTAAGALKVMIFNAASPIPSISISTSSNNGETWSTPTACSVTAPWPDLPCPLYACGSVVEATNGTLIRFVYGNAGEGSRYSNPATWSSTHYKAYAIRSTNGGSTWSTPVEIDQPAWYLTARGTIIGSLDLMEVTGVAIGNTVTAVTSPIYSTHMWQCWSSDAGATWDAASRTTFSGTAQSMARTGSGRILVAHQHPGYSLNISEDGGLNWDAGTVIDYSGAGMGCIIATGSDTALIIYTSSRPHQPMQAQSITMGGGGSMPVTGSLWGNVNLEGFTASSSNVAVGIELIQNNVVVRSDAVVLDPEGNYTLSGVKPGTYSVRFKASSWLAKIVAGKVVTAGNATMCSVSLTNGDVDGDNEVTTTDLSTVITGGQ